MREENTDGPPGEPVSGQTPHAPETTRRAAGAAYALVADDDEQQASLVVRLLRSRGLYVREARRGLETLNLLRKDPPDLLILDAGLPEVHGFDVAQKVKRNERFRHIRIIMTSSAYRGWRIAEDLRETFGVDAFIEKPFRLNALWKSVERVLEQARGHKSAVPPRKMAASAFKAYRDGLKRGQAGDTDGAIACLRDGVQLDPLSPKLHFQLGVLYLKRRGMAYQAMQAFEEVLKLDPQCFSALKTLGTLYEQKGFRNQALDMWERALRCSPDEDTAAEIRVKLLGLI